MDYSSSDHSSDGPDPSSRRSLSYDNTVLRLVLVQFYPVAVDLNGSNPPREEDFIKCSQSTQKDI